MRDDERVQGGDAVDERIDAAVRSYAQPSDVAEPRVAFARIMDRAQAERPAQAVPWWMWGIAGAAACLAVMMAALWVMRMPRVPQIARTPQAPKVVAVPATPTHAEVANAPAPPIPRAAHAHSAPQHRELAGATTSLPKLDVFPTPRPLTPQEQALVAFARHAPPEVQRAVLEDQKHWDDPIIVADLQKRLSQSSTQQDR